MLTRQEALQLVDHYISSADKRKHVIAVSAIMKSLAETIGANEDEWELVGLMHDLDCDLVKGDMRRHRLVAAEMLEGKLSESCIRDIKAHDYRSGIEPKSTIDKALIATDCVLLLIVRAALATPQRKTHELGLGVLKKVFESESFPVFLRNGILTCKDIGLTLEQFLQLALAAIPNGLTINSSDL
jgi:predicted hydrolase (HD superfamily)